MSSKIPTDSFAAKGPLGEGSAVEVEEGFVVAGDGLRLFVRSWTPRSGVRANVVLTHGLGEHSGRYFHVGEFLAARGFRLCAYDLRGHGKSEGSRGDVPSYNCLLDDLGSVSSHYSRGDLSQIPTFFYGHSFGAQVVVNFAADRTAGIVGVILASPLLELAFQPRFWKVWLAKAALHLAPSFVQETGMLDERLSRDRAFLDSLRDRDLVHRKMSARLYAVMLDGAARATAAASRFRMPLLLIHGGDDPVTSMPASRRFFKKAASEDKTLQIYPGMLHETHNECDRESVLAEIAQWLTDRSAHPRVRTA